MAFGALDATWRLNKLRKLIFVRARQSGRRIRESGAL
jgi:hypothetical protein